MRTDRAAGQRAGLPSPPSLLQPHSELGSSGLSALRPTLDMLVPSPPAGSSSIETAHRPAVTVPALLEFWGHQPDPKGG